MISLPRCREGFPLRIYRTTEGHLTAPFAAPPSEGVFLFALPAVLPVFTKAAEAESQIITIKQDRAAAVGAEEGLRLWRWCGGVVVRCLVHLRHALGLGLHRWWLHHGRDLGDEKRAAHLEGTLTPFSVAVSRWFPASITRNNRQGRRDVPTGAARPGSYIAGFSGCLVVASWSAVVFGTMAK